jgi:perosamine synthetase
MIRTIARYGIRSVPGDEKEVVEAFRRGEAIDGSAIAELEQRFAEYHEMGHAVTASYGRMAFYYILRALELPPGSEIIFPALTFWVVPEMARRCGLVPVFVDVDPLTFNIVPEKIAAAITTRTRAIVPTHLYGHPCDMEPIMQTAAAHNLIVIEDCAQAAGARNRGGLVGTFGAASFFSFQMLKGINTYGGGMAMTNDSELAARIRDLARNEPPQSTPELVKRFATGFAVRCLVSPKGFTFWGFPVSALLSLFGYYELSSLMWEKIRPLDPFPSSYRRRYSNVQAILGLRALRNLGGFNQRCRSHASVYTNGLGDCRAIQLPKILPDVEHVYYQYCIYASNPEQASRRAIRKGVDFETTHVDVCSTLPLFAEFAADCPGAEETAHALQLPVYSRLRHSDVERVLRVVRDVTSDMQSLNQPGITRSAPPGTGIPRKQPA